MSRDLTFMQRLTVADITPPQRSDGEQKILDRLAIMVGLVAFGLPVVLAFGATWGDSCFRNSLSHFYYAQFLGPVFVGMLFFIGGFLIAYVGDLFWRETVGSAVAGVMACAIALFPTAGSGCDEAVFLSRVFVEVTALSGQDGPLTVARATTENQNFFELFSEGSIWATIAPATDLHMAAAGIVFVYLGLFCIFVLRRVIPARHGIGATLKASKRNRNTLYLICGVTILLCVAFLALRETLGISEAWLRSWDGVFVVETIALWAFALAWFTKGRGIKPLND